MLDTGSEWEDSPDYKALKEAGAEISKGRKAMGREWSKKREAWQTERGRACDPYEEARGEVERAGLDHFGISLPPGLDFGMGISFF